jgi:hypothetical protein
MCIDKKGVLFDKCIYCRTKFKKIVSNYYSVLTTLAERLDNRYKDSVECIRCNHKCSRIELSEHIKNCEAQQEKESDVDFIAEDIIEEEEEDF